MSKANIRELMQTVRCEGGDCYSVESESLPGWRYLCWISQPPRCQCEDHKRRSRKSASYLCKHLKAVRLFLECQAAIRSLFQKADLCKNRLDTRARVERKVPLAEVIPIRKQNSKT